MADEKASIVITDKVDPNIAAKLRIMAQAAMNANSAVTTLQNSLKSINSNALRLLQQAGSAATRELQQAAIAAARLATEQQRTAAAAARATGAQAQAQLQLQRVTQQLALAAAQLAAAQNRANNAATSGQVAAARLAAQQARVQAQQSAAAAAADRAALAALRLEQAQNRVGSSAGIASSSIRNYVAALASLSSVTSVLKVADTFTTLNNKLRVVAPTQEHVNELMGRLGDLSVNTRSSLESTVTSFARFDRALKLMGKSQEDTLRMTETVNKALIIGGATAQEASSALLQLSQAFNSGRLQGDEFRSISENMPMVLDAVAKALGTTSDKVKQMSTDGKISAKVMYDAFKIMEAEVDKTFASMNITIGQSLEILRTKWTLFIGDLDKATGISFAVGNAIRTLAMNLNYLGVIAPAVASALLVYFGPALVGAITAATNAMWVFTAAIAANPIGLLLVALSTAISYIAIFGDEIKVGESNLITLKDTALGVFDLIVDGYNYLNDAFNSAINSIVSIFGDSMGELPVTSASIMDEILLTIKTGVNQLIGLFVGAYKGIVYIWEKFPAFMVGVFAKVANFAMDSIEKIVNYWIDGIKSLISIVNPEAAKALDALKVTFSRMEGSTIGADFGSGFVDTLYKAFNADYIGKLGDAIGTKAGMRASARLAEAMVPPGGSLLRGAGPNQLGDAAAKGGRAKKTSGKTDEEKRVDFLKKINLELDNEIARFGVLGPLREMQAKYDAIQEKMAGKGWTLSEKENESIRNKIALNQTLSEVQKNLDSIYNETAGKIRDVQTNQIALNLAVQQGLISTGTYSAELVKLQFEAETANAKMGLLTTEGFGVLAMEGVLDGFKGNLSDLTDIFSDFYSNMVDGFSNSIGQMIVNGDSLKESLLNVAQTITTTLISALVKLGLQYVINAALAQTTQAATVATSTALAASTAAAWAPAAAAVSLASYGSNAVAANAGILSTHALSKTMSMATFEKGGYTGDLPTSSMAGIVHGQEFVMNAAATQRIGVPTLQALQDGASLQSVSSSSNNVGFGGVNVTIENYGVSKDFEVQQLSETDIRIIARDEANAVVENKAESVVANKLANANSTMSKALTNNLNVTRKR